jgi:hypothetical protein
MLVMLWLLLMAVSAVTTHIASHKHSRPIVCKIKKTAKCGL